MLVSKGGYHFGHIDFLVSKKLRVQCCLHPTGVQDLYAQLVTWSQKSNPCKSSRPLKQKSHGIGDCFFRKKLLN